MVAMIVSRVEVEVEVEVEVMRVTVVTELTVIFHDFSLFTLFHYQCPDIYYTSFHLFHNYVIFCVSLLLFIHAFYICLTNVHLMMNSWIFYI